MRKNLTRKIRVIFFSAISNIKNGIYISNLDANTLLDYGTYYCDTLTNGPINDYAQIEVFKSALGVWVVQICFEILYPNKAYYRVYNNGSWRDWHRIALWDDSGWRNADTNGRVEYRAFGSNVVIRGSSYNDITLPGGSYLTVGNIPAELSPPCDIFYAVSAIGGTENIFLRIALGSTSIQLYSPTSTGYWGFYIMYALP